MTWVKQETLARHLVELDPPSLARTSPASLRKRHVADAGGEISAQRRVRHEMAQEILPADPIRIDIATRRGRLLPAGAVIDREVDCWIECRDFRSIDERLHVTTMQPCNGGALRAVDLERHEIVAQHPRCQYGNNNNSRAQHKLNQGDGLVFQ